MTRLDESRYIADSCPENTFGYKGVNMKEERVKMLMNCLLNLEELKKEYLGASPGWILIHAAQNHLKSVYYLEESGCSDEKTLGVKDEIGT